MRSLLFWIAWHREKRIGFIKSVLVGAHTFKELRRIGKTLNKLGGKNGKNFLPTKTYTD